MSAVGSPVASINSVDGFTYGYKMMFCRSGFAPGASRPRLACILPNSSNAVAFISSCIPLGWKGISAFPFPGRNLFLSELKPKLTSPGFCEPSLIRANPSHRVAAEPVAPGALHQPADTKSVP
jgi:hypothetical protein